MTVEFPSPVHEFEFPHPFPTHEFTIVEEPHDRWQELVALLKKPNTLVVNLYGGPGTGKSTTAALVFGLLKQRGITAELAPEVAKDFVWEQRERTLENQVYIFGKQYHRIWRLVGQVDVVISDGPLLLSLYYARNVVGGPEVAALAKIAHASMNNLDIYLTRNNVNHPYDTSGRYQTLQQAEKVDREIRKTLDDAGCSYIEVEMGDGAAETIADLVEKLVTP